jgi:stress responsive alpha/beta barrel protein
VGRGRRYARSVLVLKVVVEGGPVPGRPLSLPGGLRKVIGEAIDAKEDPVSGFRHVVLFRFRDGVTTEQKQTLADRLRGLPGVIPELKAYAVGEDAGINSGNFDFAVVADFDDRDGYLAYRDHPEHRQVIDECVTPIVAERGAVQHAL